MTNSALPSVGALFVYKKTFEKAPSRIKIGRGRKLYSIPSADICPVAVSDRTGGKV